MFVAHPDSHGVIDLTAWGPGAAWSLDQAPALLGALDRVPQQLWPAHPAVDAARRSLPHLRIGRMGMLAQVAVPTVIEQRVTSKEAFGSYGTLVRRFGRRAPGPAGQRSLLVPPSEEQWQALPSWEWVRAGVDHQRAAALTQLLSRCTSIERAVARDPTQSEGVLRSVPGTGVWTAAEIRARAWGDPDAVSFGDYHVAADVGVAVNGSPFDDAEMARFLEPWAGQRGRVVQWILRHHGTRPRRGPRMAPRRHLP